MLELLNILDYTDDRMINRLNFANIAYGCWDCFMCMFLIFLMSPDASWEKTDNYLYCFQMPWGLNMIHLEEKSLLFSCVFQTA